MTTAAAEREARARENIPTGFGEEARGPAFVIRCGCGIASMTMAPTPAEAAVLAQTESGFSRIGKRFWCRKCARDEKRRRRFEGSANGRA